MTDLVPGTFSPLTAAEPSSAIRRVTSLATMEARLLGRNPTALAIGILGAPLTVMLFAIMNFGGDQLGASYTTFLIVMLGQWGLIMTVFYNVCSILVARREDGVLRRLTTGQATRVEVVSAAAIPSAVVLVAQVVLSTVLASVVFYLPAFANPLLAVIGLAGGIVVAALAAAAMSGCTSSVESAQFTTLPVFVLSIALSGVTVPAALLPSWLGTVAALTPLHAVGELLMLGLNGQVLGTGELVVTSGTWLLALRPVVVVMLWAFLTLQLARRFTRFDTRG